MIKEATPSSRNWAFLWRSARRRIRGGRPAYGGPATDTHRSVHVGVGSVPARCAHKRGLCSTGGFIALSTLRTFPRRVARIDHQHGDASLRCFGRNKLAHLAKRPTVEDSTLRATSPEPRAKSRQRFEGYRALRALRSLYQAFGDDMVGMGGKAAFLTGQPSETAPRAKRACALQCPAQAAMARAHVLDVRSTDGVAIAGRRKIRDAKINAKHACNVKLLEGLCLPRRLTHPMTADLATTWVPHV